MGVMVRANVKCGCASVSVLVITGESKLHQNDVGRAMLESL